MIRVLIVDDSQVAQVFLAHLLTADPGLEVAGFANNGAEALDAVKYLRPDVITMDIHMRQVNGYEATRAIMATLPTPIVIVSGSATAKESLGLFQALDAGALAVVVRPPGIGDPDYPAAAQALIQTIKTIAAIKVVRRYGRVADATAITVVHRPVPSAPQPIRLVAIGASIGGPAVLNSILSRLPRDLPVPVLIVQHIASGFVEGFIEWLTTAANFPLHLAQHGQEPQPGHGYIAPDGYHMGLMSSLRIGLSDHAPEQGSRPAVGYLFRTVAKFLGPRAIGVLLTGMGRDGADDLKALRDTGATTIAQDEATSVVHGMPGEAIKLGAATYILPPDKIAATLVSLSRPPMPLAP